MNFTEFQGYAWIISLGSFLSVFIGWRVVYRNAKRIASRSESKAISDHLIKLVNDSIDLSVNFWMEDDNSKGNKSLKFSLSVSTKITQIDDFIGILSSRGIEINRMCLADFSTSLTLDAELHFEMDQDVRAERCQQCVEDGMTLITHIYSCFEKQHPPENFSNNNEFPHYLEHFEDYCHGCFRPYNDGKKY